MTKKPQSKITSDVEKTTYLVERGSEKLRITVPSSWKVTFGPMVPGSQGKGYQQGTGPNCLRFYEATDKQRAIFTGVTGFRDTALPVEKLSYKVEVASSSKKDSKTESSKHQVEKEEEWLPF